MSTIELRPPSHEPNSRKRCAIGVGGLRITMTFDTNLPTQRYIHEMIAAGLCYEEEATAALLKGLGFNDVFYDIGANCGWFSAIALARDARVFAWEPDAINLAALRQNAPQAVTFSEAIYHVSGPASLFVNLDNDGGHALWPCGDHPHNAQTEAAGHPSQTIHACTLDSLITLPPPNVLKIDTEGAEWNVLVGGGKTLASPALRMVICERNEFGLAAMGHYPEQIETIMRAHGFTWEQPKSEHVSNWIFTR